MMRAFVTGGNGFVAQWVIKAMLERGWHVTAGGVGERPAAEVLDEDERRAVAWRAMDITVQADVDDAMACALPDVVVHLAAVSHVPDAQSHPGYAYEVNTVGTVRLLAEVGRYRRAGTLDPVVLVVGSAEQYGRHETSDMPLDEQAAQRPLTLYAASKVAQEIAALQFFRSDGLRIVCTRSFNHSGAGQSAHFLMPGLIGRAVALPARGGRLMIGNGETVRDFLHVSDAVEAYLALGERASAGEVYNVSSGDGVSVRTLAESVLHRLGRTAEITNDPTLSRIVDVPVLIGNSRKLRRATGWTPRRTRDDIIDDLIHAATR